MSRSSHEPVTGRRRFRVAAVLVLGLSLLGGGAALAQSMRPLEGPRPTITEFRGYAFIQAGLEDEIWRLASNGHATMVYGRRGGHAECDAGGGCYGSDAGTWSEASGRLCVSWETRPEVTGCYTILPEAGIHVRLVGPLTFEGTLERG